MIIIIICRTGPDVTDLEISQMDKNMFCHTSVVNIYSVKYDNLKFYAATTIRYHVEPENDYHHR